MLKKKKANGNQQNDECTLFLKFFNNFNIWVKMIFIFTFLQSIHCIFVVNMLSIHCWSQIVKVLLLKPAPSMSNMNYWIFKTWRICQKETCIFLSSPSFEQGSNTIFLNFFSLLLCYSDNKNTALQDPYYMWFRHNVSIFFLLH